MNDFDIRHMEPEKSEEKKLNEIPKVEELPCAACKHPKHMGRTCRAPTGKSVMVNGGVAVEELCQCGDAHARKDDKNKAKGWALLPFDVLAEVAAVYHAGAKKYAPNSWQDVPPDPETKQPASERYFEAAFRHIEAERSGEEIDADTGCFHRAQIIWNFIAYAWMRKRGK